MDQRLCRYRSCFCGGDRDWAFTRSSNSSKHNAEEAGSLSTCLTYSTETFAMDIPVCITSQISSTVNSGYNKSRYNNPFNTTRDFATCFPLPMHTRTSACRVENTPPRISSTARPAAHPAREHSTPTSTDPTPDTPTTRRGELACKGC